MQDRTDFIPEAVPSVSLREYGDILRRRRAIILQTFVIVLVAGVLITLFQTPTYQALGRLLVKPSGINFQLGGDSDPLVDVYRPNQGYTVMTQVEILQSSEIRKKVLDKIGGELPLFQIRPLENTSIIEVSAEGDNQDRVALAVNTMLKVYSEHVNDKESGGLNEALKTANKQLADATQRKTRAEDMLRKFRERNGIGEFEESQKQAQMTVATTGSAYRQSQEQLRAIAVKREAIRRMLGSVIRPTRTNIVSPEADPMVNDIQNTLVKLQIARKALVAKQLDIPLDELSALDIQIRDWSGKLAEARRSYIQRNSTISPEYIKYADQLLQLDVDQNGIAAMAAEQSKTLADASRRLAQFPAWEQIHRRLQQEIAASTAALSFWSEQKQKLDLRQQTRISSVLVIDNAVPPTDPIRPKRAQSIAVSVILGLFLGLCLALLQELFDDRINSPEEAERVLRLPSLGHVPMIEEEGLRMIRDISTFSPLMESYRSLRTNINFAAVGSSLRTMIVTSSVPAEGKSTTVANLAMAMAMEGKRVIIVDADLRRPSQHKLFKVDSSPGLTDILLETHRVEQVLRPTNVEGVRILPAGTPPPNPAELLGSAAMMRLIENLKEMADIVLFDSPPALAVADSVVLSSRVDGVLLVIAFGETKKANTRRALEQLGRASAHVLGTVLNRMEGPSSGYYYGKYYVPATIDSATKRAPASVESAASTSGAAALPSGQAEEKGEE